MTNTVPDEALPPKLTDAEVERIMQLAKRAGFNLDPTPNMLYTVRGNTAQILNFAHLLAAEVEQKPEHWDEAMRQARELNATPPSQPQAAPVGELTDEAIDRLVRIHGWQVKQSEVYEFVPATWRSFARAIVALSSPVQQAAWVQAWFDEWELVIPQDAREAFRQLNSGSKP